jgi:acyl carrier protein
VRARGSGDVVALRESVRGFLQDAQKTGQDNESIEDGTTMEMGEDGADSQDYVDFLSALEDELMQELAQELVFSEEQEYSAAQVRCIRYAFRSV